MMPPRSAALYFDVADAREATARSVMLVPWLRACAVMIAARSVSSGSNTGITAPGLVTVSRRPTPSSSGTPKAPAIAEFFTIAM